MVVLHKYAVVDNCYFCIDSYFIHVDNTLLAVYISVSRV